MLVVHRRLFSVFAAVVIAALSPAVRAVEVESGYDWILTGPGTRVQIPMLADDPLNPDKWVSLMSFPYSNPFAGAMWGDPTPGPPVSVVFQTTWYDPHGAAIPPSPYGASHAVTQVITPIAIVNGAFDTVIGRPNSFTIGGVGTEVSTDLKIDWLSLQTVQPISLQGQAGFFDLYVGIDRTTAQSELTGKMTLRSGSPNGDSGWINLGDSATQGDEDLGLPVNWIGYLIPHGLDPEIGNAVANFTGFNLFQNVSWIPEYVIVPEPATAALVGLSFVGLLAVIRRKRP